MILHLFHDDKICNRVVANFEEVYPGGNIYICICDTTNIKYVQTSSHIIFINRDNYNFDQSKLIGVKKIVIHYLDLDKINFIEKLFHENIDIEIYWSLWGGDIYNEVLYSMGYNIYDDKSYVDNLKIRFINFINRCLGRPTAQDYINAIVSFIERRINYIMSFQAEYDLISDIWNLKHFKPKVIPNMPIYYPIEDILGVLCDKRINGNNIIIGNSASFTNNHAYAYSFLSKCDTKGFKKISPLSYGGSLEYRKYVKTIGYKYWGEDFCPLDNFLPLDEYNNLMLSSSIYVYGNWRQEAVGNIVMALYLGAKVFVSEKSPLLEIFSDFGIKLYKTEEISSEDILKQEDEVTIHKNRQNILNVYSKSAILNNIKTIFG